MRDRPRRWGWGLFWVALGAGAWLLIENNEELEAFADGVLGETAIEEGLRMESEMRAITDERDRQIQELSNPYGPNSDY